MKKTTFIYGLALAALAVLLKTIEYKWMVKDITVEIYITIIAIVFCVLGMWVGNRLVERKNNQLPFEKNNLAIKSLGLSTRELQILTELLQGHTNQKIAENLFISINTVKTHLKNSYSKLDVNNRILAIEKLKSLNIIEK
jgi:DNA-binding NarL/FixJ family response regulator